MTPAARAADPVLAAAGDIACPADRTATADATTCQQSATAQTIQAAAPTAVAALGDNQYDSATLTEFHGTGAFDDTWGQFKPLVRPAPGNHEYMGTAGAPDYGSYFGPKVGAMGHYYYSYDVGDWHIVSLDSNCSPSGDCSDTYDGYFDDAQMAWLQQDLADHPGMCTLAYWHHPYYYDNGQYLNVAPAWSRLLAAHADVVLNGHVHNYERFGKQDAAGNASADGIREFVVGTGGEDHAGLDHPRPNEEFADDTHFGALMLTLHPGGYDWEFRATDGTTLDPSAGATACNRHATNVALGVAPNPAPSGSSTTLDAAVTDAVAPAVPTGTVTFERDGQVLGSAPVDATGHARLTVDPQAPGTYTFRARYSGSNTALRAASAPVAQTVQPEPPLEVTPPAATPPAGTPPPAQTSPPAPVSRPAAVPCAGTHGVTRSRCLAKRTWRKRLAACARLRSRLRPACVRRAGVLYRQALLRADLTVCRRHTGRARRTCSARAEARYRRAVAALKRSSQSGARSRSTSASIE